MFSSSVCERIESKDVSTVNIHTTDHITNIFTKPLGREHFKFLIDNLGVQDLHNPLWEGELEIFIFLF